MKILVLADRDWRHPDAGGTGTTLHALVPRWLQAGHTVTMVVSRADGLPARELPHERLEIRRMGTRLTLFPRAALACWRGLGRDADVVLEVVNGIAFCTPLWRFLRAPTVVMVQHVHQRHYVEELGWLGRVGALFLERLPLRWLYRRRQVWTISEAVREDLVALGIPLDHITIIRLGVAKVTSEEPRAALPTLLYLGRMKRYKRPGLLLDVLEGTPQAVLEVGGDGDHREAFEEEVVRRGLSDRVIMHGFVAEADKADLYRRAWVMLTASAAEGWGLTVMEAAVCATPTAALRVGGLVEAIVDGETGVLADHPQELAARAAELLASPSLRERMGAAAAARADAFSWDDTASRGLDLLRTEADGARAVGDQLPVGGIATATVWNICLQLGFTMVLARLLGISAYGAFATLMSVFLVVFAAAQALQLEAARRIGRTRPEQMPAVASGVRRWLRYLGLAAVGATAAGIIVRRPLANVLGVPNDPWAVAAIFPTWVAWLVLSLQRGVLQGLRHTRALRLSLIAEPVFRLLAGGVFVVSGAGVTGAFIGTSIAIMLTAAAIGLVVGPALGDASPESVTPTSLLTLGAAGWAVVLGLTLLTVLQTLDLVVIRHSASPTHAGAYAAAAVAAKAILWIVAGAGIYLFVDSGTAANRCQAVRAAQLRALRLVGLLAAPMLIIFAAFPGVILRVVFGPQAGYAADYLVVLAAATTLLSVAYVSAQYMLALCRFRFLWLLGAVVIVEPVLLGLGHSSALTFAVTVLAIDGVVGVIMLSLGLRAGSRLAVGALGDTQIP